MQQHLKKKLYAIVFVFTAISANIFIFIYFILLVDLATLREGIILISIMYELLSHVKRCSHPWVQLLITEFLYSAVLLSS